VIVVELDPLRALEAAFDGMRVAPLARALAEADSLFTVTGRPGVVTAEDFGRLRDGIVLANVGHFGTEIDVPALARVAVSRAEVREHVDEYALADGRRVRVLAGGEMLNLTAANGHQMQIMDLGFALQAHSLWLLAQDRSAFAPGYNPVPAEVDRAVAEGGLAALSTVER